MPSYAAQKAKLRIAQDRLFTSAVSARAPPKRSREAMPGDLWERTLDIGEIGEGACVWSSSNGISAEGLTGAVSDKKHVPIAVTSPSQGKPSNFDGNISLCMISI